MEKTAELLAKNQIIYQSRSFICKEVQQAFIYVIEANISIRNAAKLFKMPYRTAEKIFNKYSKHRVVPNKKVENTKDDNNKEKEEIYIEKIISMDCTITLSEMQQRLMSDLNIKISLHQLYNILKQLNYTYKYIKNFNKKSVGASLQGKTIECSHKYLRLLNEKKINIFYHECEVQVNIISYGWVKKVKTKRKKIPAAKSKKISIMALIICDEIVFYAQGSEVNWFCLVNHLCDLLNLFNNTITNITFIMDDLPLQMDGEIRQFIEERGHQLLFLPPDSTFFKPIRKVFMQWKSILRKKSTDDIEKFNHLFTKEKLFNYYEKAKNNFQKYLNFSPMTIN